MVKILTDHFDEVNKELEECPAKKTRRSKIPSTKAAAVAAQVSLNPVAEVEAAPAPVAVPAGVQA